jgi:hypothetical protein
LTEATVGRAAEPTPSDAEALPRVDDRGLAEEATAVQAGRLAVGRAAGGGVVAGCVDDDVVDRVRGHG